jgi:hypothetical protein
MASKRNRIAWVMMATVVTSLSWARTETGSFLNKHAWKSNELVQQLQHQQSVQERYVRHYGKSVSEIRTLFASLHLAKLNKDLMTTVYSVRDDGVVRARMFHLKKGTLVFADLSGRAVLKHSCGNPMNAGSEYQQVPITSDLIGEDAPLKDLMLEPETVAVDDALIAEQPTPDIPQIVDETMTTAVEPQLIGPEDAALVSMPSFSFPGWLPLLGGALLVPGAPGGGGGPSDNEPPPVPEPVSMALLGVGAAVMVARKRRR